MLELDRAPVAKWFVGGKINISVQLPRPAPRRTGRGEQGGDHLGGRARRRADAHLLASCNARSARFANVLEALGVERGRPRRDLHADDPRAGDRDARLRAASARSTRSSSAASRAESLRDRINDAAGEGWSSPPTAAGGAGRCCRSRRSVDEALAERPTVENVVVVQRATGERRSTHGRRAATSGSTSLDGRSLGRLPAPSRWTPRTLLFILYTSGTTGQAEGHRAHHRRLHGRHATPRRKCVFDLQGRGRLLVHRRHRLGHRAQLHRLRPARQRRDHA